MKISQILEDLMDLAKKLGITVRKDKGTFKSGYCILNDQKLLLVNKSTTPETLSYALAKLLAEHPIDEMYLKPAVRDFIIKEKDAEIPGKKFELNVEY
jgi:hypothetical protein